MTSSERRDLRAAVDAVQRDRKRDHALARETFKLSRARKRLSSTYSVAARFTALIGHSAKDDPLVQKLRAAMAGESPIDLDTHAARIALDVYRARAHSRFPQNTEPGVTFHGAAPGSDTKGL